MVEAPVIEKILRDDGEENHELEHKCRSLIEAAKEAGGPDNVTCVLLRGTNNWPSSSDHAY